MAVAVRPHVDGVANLDYGAQLPLDEMVEFSALALDEVSRRQVTVPLYHLDRRVTE